MIVDLIKKNWDIKENLDFDPTRKRPIPFRDSSRTKQATLIKKDPTYGEMVCRCEHVSKKEVLNAINNPLSAKTIPCG